MVGGADAEDACSYYQDVFHGYFDSVVFAVLMWDEMRGKTVGLIGGFLAMMSFISLVSLYR